MTLSTGDSLRRMREQKPLVHQITNYVVMNETANATLAIGALPVMAHAREEVEEMAALAGALVINIGTLSPHWVEAMLLAGKAANAAGAPAAIVTGGHGDEPVDHLFDGREHHEIAVERHDVPATHGAGCTHSATLAALLALELPLREAAEGAARVAGDAVRHGLTSIGNGDGPVDVFHLERPAEGAR